MEKQPNSRMCFRDVFGVRHRHAPGARSACTSSSTPTTRAGAWPASLCLAGTGQAGRSRSTRATPANCTGAYQHATGRPNSDFDAR
jgi:hypothetical protein